MISLIVATLGRVAELDRLLASLEKQTFGNFEVILVDQNSDDRLNAVVLHYPRLRICHVRSLRGLSRARNAGLRKAKGDLIAIPDDDCWYPTELLDSVHAWFVSHPMYSLLGAALRTAEGRPCGPNSPSASQACTRANVWSCAISTTLFMRSSVTDVVHDFNEDIGVGADSKYQSGEETDYVLRALNNGFLMWYESALTVHHPPLKSLNRLRKATYPFALGSGYVLRLHHYRLCHLLYFVARSGGGALTSLFRGNWSLAHVYALRATGQFLGYISGGHSLGKIRASPARK